MFIKIRLLLALSILAVQIQAANQNNPGGGGEIDPSGHGCAVDGGFQWCPSLNQCVRPWVTACPGGTVI